jgi:hypothetical protein
VVSSGLELRLSDADVKYRAANPGPRLANDEAAISPSALRLATGKVGSTTRILKGINASMNSNPLQTGTLSIDKLGR